jgi:hypothetical protein
MKTTPYSELCRLEFVTMLCTQKNYREFINWTFLEINHNNQFLDIFDLEIVKNRPSLNNKINIEV